MTTTMEHKEALPASNPEKQPLDADEHVVVTIPSSTNNSGQGDNDGVVSYVMNPNDRATADNPFREGTYVGPVLVRRVNSEQLLPRPFKSFRQLVVASYLSFLCLCCCFSAYANHLAVNASIQRNKGLNANASRTAKRARFWILASFITGFSLVTFAVILNVVLWLTTDHFSDE